MLVSAMSNKSIMQIVPKRRNSQPQGYTVDTRVVFFGEKLQLVNLAQKKKSWFCLTQN